MAIAEWTAGYPYIVPQCKMMCTGGNALSVFNVTIRKDEAGYYVARCLELPAAMTQGKTEEEAIHNIKEAIHLVLVATNKEQIMKPTVRAIELVA